MSFLSDLVDKVWFATEFLPGQYDQRSDSAEQCLMLLNGKSDVKIRSGKLYVFNSELSERSLQKIKNYMINPVESREKSLDTLVGSSARERKGRFSAGRVFASTWARERQARRWDTFRVSSVRPGRVRGRSGTALRFLRPAFRSGQFLPSASPVR